MINIILGRGMIMESLELIPVRIRITSILKKAIFNGEYKSGDELSLTDIAKKLGVSRTPVREAFQALEADGLIELRMNKGAIVKNIDEKFIRNHYEMRILLEGEAAARAAKNGMDVSELLTRLYHFQDNFDAMSVRDYEDLNFDVHSAIWKAADNQKLYDYLANLWNGPSVGKYTSAREHYTQSTKEHIQILIDIRNQDAEAARHDMDIHTRRSMNNILRNLNQTQEA